MTTSRTWEAKQYGNGWAVEAAPEKGVSAADRTIANMLDEDTARLIAGAPLAAERLRLFLLEQGDRIVDVPSGSVNGGTLRVKIGALFAGTIDRRLSIADAHAEWDRMLANLKVTT